MLTTKTIHHPIGILDTGDNYIICLKDESTYKDAIMLYESMELEVKEIDTESRATPEGLQFIHSTIGRVITYGLFVDVDVSREKLNTLHSVPARLIHDVEIIANFAKSKVYWENMQYPPKQIATNEIAAIPNNIYTIIHDDRSHLYIFYNTIYNLAIVKEYSELQSSARDISKYFSDFVIAIEIKTPLPEGTLAAFNNIFHKKSFDNVETIKQKYTAFCDLFGIGTKTCAMQDEQGRVRDFLTTSYIMSTDESKRIKANELYKTVINHMCIDIHDVVTFKKRLAGYLVSLNLQKKRFSDAYYFYGLEAKQVKTPFISDILKQRAIEQGSYNKSENTKAHIDPFTNELNPITRAPDTPF